MLIETLQKHMNESNKQLVNVLLDTIKDNNITTIDELIEIEKSIFTLDGKILNNSERIEYAKEITFSSYWDYDGLTLDKINVIGNLKDSLKSDISDEQKIYNLIKLFDITDKECLFLYEAYVLITNDKY